MGEDHTFWPCFATLDKKNKTSCIKCTLIFVLDEVWQVLEATGFTDKYDSQIYLSVHDAVLAATVEGEGEYGNEVGISGSHCLFIDYQYIMF